MSIAEKLTTIAENLPKVYDSGVDKGEGNVWDIIQNFGTRPTYDYCFFNWRGVEYIRPKYKVVYPENTSGDTFRSVFENCYKLKKIEAKYFDFSNRTPNTSASSTGCNYATFRNNGRLEEIEDIGLQAGGYYFTWGWCQKLHTIAVMRCVKDGTYYSPFTQCYELQNITIEGVIGNNISFADCSKLTIESLRSIISALYDFVENCETETRTLTLHQNAYDRSPEEIIEEAKEKGWSVVVA